MIENGIKEKNMEGHDMEVNDMEVNDGNNRPTFITIMAVLSLISGVAILGIQLMGLSKFDELLSSFDVMIIAIYIVVFLLGILSLSSGIGMLKGYRWGWYLGTFNHIFSIIRNAVAFVYLAINYETFNGLEGNVTRAFIKHGVRVALWSWIAIYFFNEKVFDYFKLDFSKRKVFAIKIIVISILLIIIRDTVVQFI